jgi:hypothetical protein
MRGLKAILKNMANSVRFRNSIPCENEKCLRKNHRIQVLLGRRAGDRTTVFFKDPLGFKGALILNEFPAKRYVV